MSLHRRFEWRAKARVGAPLYELTEWGYEAEPITLTMACY
jgi:hypothetical protein